MKRLTLNKAKKALEVRIKNRIGANDVEMNFIPYCYGDCYKEFRKYIPKDALCRIDVNITYFDGKGFTTPLLIQSNKYSTFNTSIVQQSGRSFAKLIRSMEKAVANGAVFGIQGCEIFAENDTVEQALVEADLS